MTYSIRPLGAEHQVSKFTCGKGELDNYLQSTAKQHQSKDVARTYVIVDDDDPGMIIGFFTMAIRSMTCKDEMPVSMAKRLPSNVPGYTLARLAISKSHQGQGLGEKLLVEAMTKAKAAAKEVDGFALFVDAKDEDAAGFYKKYGFTSFPSNPLILVIPIASIPG
ncbi:MAG TPA: GNAT family N-acetyltransferase [Duganella sp.]|nr:GNAT family N-acetyltransferase [Duganella sp.]